MANVKPLRLKRQKSSARALRELQVPLGVSQVEVIVDTGVFHLDHSFSYLVKSDQVTEVDVGSIVKVPFRDKSLIGLVTRVGPAEKVNLSYIEKLIANNVLSQANIDFAHSVAARYVGNLWDILKLLLPPLNQSSSFAAQNTSVIVPKAKKSRILHRSGIGEDPLNLLCDYVSSLDEGSQLVIVPTERMLNAVINRLNRSTKSKVLEYGAHLSPNMRRKAFESLISGEKVIVVGLRNSIFAPVKNLQNILVLNEFSEHHYELRAPYWNTRDVALLRTESEACNLHFFGNSYSAELARLLNMGWVRDSSARRKTSNNKVRLICAPTTYNSMVRDSLKTGPVLLSVAGKEFASGFLCAQCKNTAICSCHGRLFMQQKDAVACSICDFTSKDWHCSHCNSQQRLIFKSGAKKIFEEVGKAFPSTDVLLSTSDKPLDSVDNKRCLVVSTSGMEPSVEDGYSGVVLLDGDQLMSRQFIRAEEELFQRWISSLRFLRNNGSVYASLPQGNKISQSLMNSNFDRFYSSLLAERQETRMPPFSRIIQIASDSRTLMSLRSKLDLEYDTKIETHISNLNTQMIIKISQDVASDFLGAIKAVQKLRSASGKQLLRVQVDPYSF